MINRTAVRKRMKLWQSVSDKDLKRVIFATLFSEDIDNGNKVLGSIQKESKVGKNFKRLMSPINLKQLSDGGLIYNRLAPIEVLLNVIQKILISENCEINKYIVLSKKYEKNLFSNNYEECKKVLEEIENAVGFSVWGCSQHLLVEELSSGLEANKKLLGKYRKEMGNNLIVNTLLDFYSCASEKNTGYINYKDKIDKYFGSLGDSVVVSYLKFKLDYNVVCTADIISIVLQIDSQLSIIDLYNSFIEILQCNSYSNYFNGEEVVVNISQYIRDYRLTNLLILYGKYDELESYLEKNKIVYEIIEKYTIGDYDTVISMSSEYSETSTEWSEHIKKRIEYILTCEINQKSEEIRADVALITAVKTESEAVKKVFKNLEKINIKNDPTIYYRIQMENNITIITAQQTEMGMASAATLSTKMIEHFKPKYLIMVGIAAGIGKDKNLGDIIIPSEVWNYSSGKYVENKNDQEAMLSFLPDPVSIPLETTIREIVSQDFKERLFKIKSEADSALENDLKVVIGPMACGAAVVANKDIVEELIKKHHRKTVGLDMESYGVFFAAKNAVVAGTIPICIKSICDFADVDKDDSAQKYAAFTSTLFAKKLIEEDLEV